MFFTFFFRYQLLAEKTPYRLYRTRAEKMKIKLLCGVPTFFIGTAPRTANNLPKHSVPCPHEHSSFRQISSAVVSTRSFTSDDAVPPSAKAVGCSTRRGPRRARRQRAQRHRDSRKYGSLPNTAAGAAAGKHGREWDQAQRGGQRDCLVLRALLLLDLDDPGQQGQFDVLRKNEILRGRQRGCFPYYL